MKRIIACTLAIFCVFVAFCNTSTDTVVVYFRLNQSDYEPMLANNAASVDSFIERIATVIASNDLDRIIINGYASPEGPANFNEQLARKRCATLAEIIANRTQINPQLIKCQVDTSGGIKRTWADIRSLVDKNPDVPNYSSIVEILNDDTLSDAQRLQRIKSLDKGITYSWVLRNIFPRLRYAMAVAVYQKPDSATQAEGVIPGDSDSLMSVDTDTIPRPPAEDLLIYDREEAADSAAVTVPADTYRPRHLLALKTNLLYYAALMPNIELEYLFHDNLSVAATGNIAWWAKESALKSYRIATLDAEMRYWIKPRAPWHGFYIGLFGGGGIYDLENKGTGYQGTGVMTGISCGFMWPISHNLSFETGIGGGYMYTHVKEYKPFEGHYVYQRTKALGYYGPLKLKFSFVWRFLDKNKSKRPQSQI